MTLLLVTDRNLIDETDDQVSDTAPPGFHWAADGCYILLKGSLFLASSYLMALGLPLLFFLVLSGGAPEAFFAQLANIADRFLAALGMIGIATLVVLWRLPRFMRELDQVLATPKS
jgi:hypothetical protein